MSVYKHITVAVVLFFAVFNITVQPALSQNDGGDRPNIVFILTDDMGYGDVGVFGAENINTPNIDRLAKEGIKFTDFYSASSVCSPSRAALMTGRYPQRMGINSVFFPQSFTGMPTSERTIAEVLNKAGYTTGLVGKWHLGHRKKYLPLQRGFDEYFGIPYSNDMNMVVYMRGNEVEQYDVDQEYITKTYTEESVSFIEDHKTDPFFLYVAHNMPHVPIYASDEFKGTSERGLYGDVIQEIDWSVGRILQKLEGEKLLKETLVVFSSDNGPWLVMRELGGSNGILRGGKQYVFEGGVRVPTLAMWKGHIPEGKVYGEMATHMDWFPTLANLANASYPKDRPIDGDDISDVLLGDGEREADEFLYMQLSDLRGYRKGKWKVKEPYSGYGGAPWKIEVPPHDSLLFNLEKDPGESNNLFNKYPEKARSLFEQMHEKYKSLGELPPSLETRQPADKSFTDTLHNRYGDDYYKKNFNKK